jgi:2'-5' RNA ligase
MRVFFALEAPAETRISIGDWRDRHSACDGRPIPVANLHITLAFAGELSDKRIERLCLAADEWQPDAIQGEETGRCQLRLDQVGYWPRPGIYWLGPAQWPQRLTQLSNRLRQAIVAAGGKRDRNNFTPHITLYRRCQNAPPAPTMAPSIDFHCDSFSLFESRQGRSGVSYHSLYEWPL